MVCAFVDKLPEAWRKSGWTGRFYDLVSAFTHMPTPALIPFGQWVVYPRNKKA